MIATFLVFLGGGIGAALRYLMVQGLFALSGMGVVWAVMTVNVVGCLLMGMGLALAERGIWHFDNVQAQLLLMTGILGGFTTFSAFSADVLKLTQSGNYLQAILCIVGSVTLSLLAVICGHYLITERILV